MLPNEISGNTTLIALAETPRLLVLAWLTGVGASVAPDGIVRPTVTALARTAAAPLALTSARRLNDLTLPRI